MNIFIEKIKRGTKNIIGLLDLEKKLQKKKQLRVKLGVDPTAPNIHLGHAIVLEKLREFQEEGHLIHFLIGDVTARIGDPTGKSKVRPILTEEEVQRNIETYKEQIGKILSVKDISIVYNSHWLSKLTLIDWLAINAKVTVAQLIERDDFQKRLAKNEPVGMHELFYPLMQGYDSLFLESDIEIGGNDQTLNMLMGRHLQEQYGHEPQVVIALPLLCGLDGNTKMSKSLQNEIGLLDDPSIAFGKIMSMRDSLMESYFILLLKYNEEKAKKIVSTMHPMECKKMLAEMIVEKYWDAALAKKGRESFENIFQKREYDSAPPLICEKEMYQIIELIQHADPSLSKTAAKNLIQSGAISFNGNKIDDFHEKITVKKGDFLKIGKHKIFTILGTKDCV